MPGYAWQCDATYGIVMSRCIAIQEAYCAPAFCLPDALPEGFA